MEKPNPNETLIHSPQGGAVGVAIRTAETADSFRMLITIRAGKCPEKIVFNFGNYDSGGIQTKGGDPGDPPPCP